ncbi:2OG-Fe(II) oxygenase [Sphingomonas sp.]|uniref:2OG-Fe(II) oxygenase n=1 Tax=Sphingomonas sp. TaxID=28214 RepID=UPI0025F2FDF2|nr:2OG-Fe(II) oxygenase [Sphingomonas sp.]
MNRIDRAYELANRGEAAAATSLLDEGGEAGEAECWVELASWYLTGQIVPRDLLKARECFRLAGDLGHEQAQSIHIALLANGAGGSVDWPKALNLLENVAGLDSSAARELAVIKSMPIGPDGEPQGPFPSEILSVSPDVRLFPGLFTAEECDWLIERSLPLLQPSLVVDPHSGQQVPNPVRTSDAVAFPLVIESPAIHALCRRLAAASGTDVKQAEPLQVLRYRPGQEYRPHFDAIGDADNQRMLTFLVYLNDDYEGGETEFLANGLKARGRKGDGLLFRNADAAGKPDLNAQHAGLPVTAGEKYLASRWIREQRFTP